MLPITIWKKSFSKSTKLMLLQLWRKLISALPRLPRLACNHWDSASNLSSWVCASSIVFVKVILQNITGNCAQSFVIAVLVNFKGIKTTMLFKLLSALQSSTYSQQSNQWLYIRFYFNLSMLWHCWLDDKGLYTSPAPIIPKTSGLPGLPGVIIEKSLEKQKL